MYCGKDFHPTKHFMQFYDKEKCCEDCGWAIDAEVIALRLHAWEIIRSRFLKRTNLIIIDPRQFGELAPPVKQFPMSPAFGVRNMDCCIAGGYGKPTL